MISIDKQPQSFTPADSPIQFKFTSDKPGALYFSVQVLDGDTGGLIANQKYQTLPNLNNGTVCDLSSVLSPFVDNQLLPSVDLLQPVSKLVKAYQLSITDNYVSGSTVITGSTLTTGIYNVWNAEFDRIQFTDFSYSDYAINAVSGNTNFLTDKPQISNIYRRSNEYLYFLNAGINAKVEFKFYGFGHTLLGSHTLSGITANTKAYRLNVSPNAIQNHYGYALSNLYGNYSFDDMFTDTFGSNYGIDNANYYTVQILDSSNIPKSELRTYILKNDKCICEPVQIVFSNRLGGFDSVTMFNPAETISVEKSIIKTYPYQIDTAGDYTNITNGVYSETDFVYNKVSESTYKVFSDVLNIETAKWLKSIIDSEKVYVKLSNGVFLPITIKNKSYSLGNKQYSTGNRRLELEFKVSESSLKF
ncbi:hypothetical protein LJ707_13300 [Mucilaginibacter sp. UR6-1]|uniref:hypothetical protein n=1 Tax=Mucilaginibacter sp. UR6-1 TaxID=1435643 RepID=UPI001E5B21E2|nr:hypothetical protein [Mucilaginibacter sp. UR6-1]MCC8409908.1 hypothetical protein [Mucilaginibacter sp. UR6-1]